MLDLCGIDGRISAIARGVDFYSFLTPLNQKEEREKFFTALRRGQSYNPVFHYRDRELGDARRSLEKVLSVLDRGDDIQQLFIKKIEFLVAQLELLEGGDANFTENAVKLYGKPDAECLDIAGSILSESKNQRYFFPEETVTPDEMASVLRRELEDRGIVWRVVISSKIVPKITVSAENRTIYINSDINYTVEEVERLRVHEIEVHVYRGANGDIQPFRIFREGLAGYDETEEGLAIVSEDFTGCLKTDTRQMKLYAGRAVCADFCLKGTFYETFASLCEFFPDDIAYRLTERGKRGLRDTSRKGGITKGFHYISGWRKVRKYVEEGGDLSILYVGKIGLDDVNTVKSLLNRGEISPPLYVPEFLKNMG